VRPRTPDQLEGEATARPGEPQSEQGRTAALLVTALAKASRAFTLYDAKNALVRQFIAEYRARAEEATSGGPLVLDILPFDLVRAGEVVYHEEDRERSLAFKMFRDGVRRITLQKGVPFAELLQLLQILAIRFTGIRQAEEDVVTLLRKAEFTGIHVAAVEGYVADEDEPEEAPGPGRDDAGSRPPAGSDRPFPRLPSPGPLAWRAVPESLLAALRAEESEAALPANALGLAREILALAGHGQVEPAEAAGYLGDLRSFLIADGQLEMLAALAEMAASQPPGRLRDTVLRGLADPRLVDALLAAVPDGSRQLPPEAVKLVPFVPAGAVLDRLADEPSEGRRDILVRVASARLPADADVVVARLPSLPADAARELWRAVTDRAPARADDAAAALLEHADDDVRAMALEAIARSAGRIPPAPLVKLLGSPVESLRIAAARALERHGDASAARAVASVLTGHKVRSLPEAEALGRTLGRLHPAVAQRLFEEWLAERRGLLGALSGGGHDADVLRWAAVSGLGVLDVPDVEARLHAVAAHGDADMKLHCASTLARRRAQERRHG